MFVPITQNFLPTISPTSKFFLKKLETRISNLIKKYNLIHMSRDTLLKEYFVEIFSWSVFTPSILDIIQEYLVKYNIKTVIDPCAGNAFHTYLIKNYLHLNVMTIDIQDEPSSWTSILEKEGRLALTELSSEEHLNSALLLSWIDYESLTIDLLELYQGNLVISVGNYEGKSPVYLQKLKEKYRLQKQIVLQMPWGLEEKIEIFMFVRLGYMFVYHRDIIRTDEETSKF